MAVTQIRGNTQILDASVTSVKLAAGIDAAKIADGSVSNTEFQYLDGVTSSIQTQLNDKQATGNYITDLTGDVTASGPGSASATLAIVNSNVGSFGDASTVPSFTVNAKGLITAASSATVVAPAGTLTGTTLNSTVVTSSLTALGSQSQALNMNSHKITGLSLATATGDAVSFDQAVLTNGTHPITGDQSFSSAAKITNLVDPLAAQDAATKAYVDAAIAGLSWKEAAQVTSVGSNVSIASPGATLDGYTLVTGDRILLRDQTAAAENGVYVFNTAITPLVRSSDANTWNQIVGMVIYIEEGTTEAGSKWVNTNVAGGTLGTTAITFTTFAAASSLDGVGTAGYNAYWTSAHTLAAEATVAAVRGGLATDASAFTGVLKASSGVFSASSIVNADIDTGAAIDYSKLSLTGDIVNADISATATIAFNKLASLTSANILVGNGSNVATSVALSGDATISNAGVLTIGSNKITFGKTEQVIREVPTGTIDGSNTTFTLAHTPTAGTECVYLDGLLQNPGAGNDYTISGNTITYPAAPMTGMLILVNYWY